MTDEIGNKLENKGFGDDLRQVGVVTHYELLKHLRSKRTLVFAGLALIVIVLITVLRLALGEMPKDPKDFMSGYVAFVSLLVIIGVSLFCAPAIASEFEERTALLVFPRPIKKTSFLVGKMLACYIFVGMVIALFYVACMILSIIFAHGVYIKTFASLGLALLFMLGAGGFAFFLSAISKKGTIAIILAIAMLLMVFNIVDGILAFYDIEPVFSLTYAGLDISNVVDGYETVRNVPVPGGGGMTMSSFYPGHLLSVSIMTVWFAVTTTLSGILFKRREF